MRRLQTIRLKLGYTQKELADKLQVQPSNISKYELGTTEPSIDVLKKISEVFGVSIDWLLENSDDPSKYSPGEVKRYYTISNQSGVEVSKISEYDLKRLSDLLKKYDFAIRMEKK